MDNCYNQIDNIIDKINKYKIDNIFLPEYELRNNKIIEHNLTNSELFKILVHLMLYSQNARSTTVTKIINSGKLNNIFSNYDINAVAKSNPCDLVDNYWNNISGIRQKTKLFHIVMLARKLKKIPNFGKLIDNSAVSKRIKYKKDVDNFWDGFYKLQNLFVSYQIPFFQSTTSLLHLLMTLGYDCAKPDLAVMKVSKKLGIVTNNKGNKNLIKTIRTMQQYAVYKNIKPTIIDLYFLINAKQASAIKYVHKEFYGH